MTTPMLRPPLYCLVLLTNCSLMMVEKSLHKCDQCFEIHWVFFLLISLKSLQYLNDHDRVVAVFESL